MSGDRGRRLCLTSVAEAERANRQGLISDGDLAAVQAFAGMLRGDVTPAQADAAARDDEWTLDDPPTDPEPDAPAEPEAEAEAEGKPGRRRRERIVCEHGHTHVQAEPRADVLHYPQLGATTILVRRTHQYDVARPLAEARWEQLQTDRLVESTLALGVADEHWRRGWWTTRTGRAPQGRGGRKAAIDTKQRIVAWAGCCDTSSGAGIEFRP